MSLNVINVSKRFRKGERRSLVSTFLRRWASPGDDHFWALRDVSLRVREGEACGVIGPNGAGKSTLLKILSGIMHPTNGRIEVRGRLSALIEVGAGFHPDLTGRENVYLNGTVLGMSRKEIKNKFDEIVAFSELESFIDTPVKRYSSGMLARLGFSVAAHVEPEVLLVDEVLSVGDYVFQRKSAAKMRSVLTSGTTVIFVSHDLRAVENICSKCVLLEKGRAIRAGKPSSIIDQYVARYSANNGEDDQSIRGMRISAIRDSEGRERNRFVSGERVTVSVLNNEESDATWVLSATADGLYEAFSVEIPFKYEKQSRSVELTLHLAPGAYEIVACVDGKDVSRSHSAKRIIYVTSEYDVRGVVQLYPEIESSVGLMKDY